MLSNKLQDIQHIVNHTPLSMDHIPTLDTLHQSSHVAMETQTPVAMAVTTDTHMQSLLEHYSDSLVKMVREKLERPF